MAVKVIAVVRKLRRKMKSTTATMRLPSRSASSTLRTERSMKLLWRKMSACTATPSGRLVLIVSSSASILRVRETVSAPGCFCTVRITPGFPSMPASPRLCKAAPSRTSAICPSRMLDPSGSTLTTVAARSSAVSTRARLRISSSEWASGRKPPEELTLDSSMAVCTSCSEIRLAASVTGSTSTWYCRTSPPITVTCETPGIPINRRRRSQSAKVRNSIGRTAGFSLVRPMAMICPMIEETGPRNGRTSRGKDGVTSATFSPTICRAR